jgi:hypothetical protein
MHKVNIIFSKKKLKNWIQQPPNRVSYQIWPMEFFLKSFWKFMDILVINI